MPWLRRVRGGRNTRSPWEVIVIAVLIEPGSSLSARELVELETAIPDTVFGDPRVLEQLAIWMSEQRWYAGKGRIPNPKLLGRLTLSDPAVAARIGVLVVLDEAERPVLYQLPLTVRLTPVPVLKPALVATLEGETPLYFYDGPHDPVFARGLLRLILDGGAAVGQPVAATGVRPFSARGHLSLPQPPTEITSSRVFGGEQSNSSIIYELADADGEPLRPVICKIFRTLQHGDNPDVVLLEALGAAGSRVVPQSFGHVSGRWADLGGGDDAVADGQLAFAQEFLPEGEDAWRIALRAAEEGRDFTIAARALGEATAEVHETLANALSATPCSPEDIAAAMTSMKRRLGLAIAEVPVLAGLRGAIEAVYARAAASPWPAMQRIHGDLHLGQVLAVPGRGWVLLDFEGEPLRPMAERNRPDLPLRDVAGMLRSFDYVAGAESLNHPGLPVAEWALACRRAFVGGYSARTGHDLRANRVLLDAFEIDKAVYEALYEARNRPSWLSIPVAAITRLAERASAS